MSDEGARDDLSVAVQTRVALGLIAMPLVAAGATLLLFPLVYYQRYYAVSPSGGYTNTRGFPLVVRIAIAVAISAVPLSLLGGGLAIGLRVFRGRVTLPQTLAVGAFVGNAPFVFFGVLQALAYARRGLGVSIDHLFPDVLSAPFVFASALGLTCAGVFWLVAGRHLGARI